MKRSTVYSMLVAVVICAAPLLLAAAKVGQAAPDFTAAASNGKTLRLQDYRGKYVVLSGTTTGVLTWASTTKAAICNACKNSGLGRASSGSRLSLRRRANRGT